MEMQYESIKEKASHLHFKSKAFINGRYVDALSGKTFSCINPATGKVLTPIASCDEADVDSAVKHARAAFKSGSWSQKSPTERKQILLKFADLLEKHQFTIALLETLDTGKPIKESLSVDVQIAIQNTRWYAELIDKLYGRVAPTANNIFAYITREPLGVVGVVNPWNFPFYIACAKLAPALAAGNSVIIKPAEQSPLTTLFLGEIANEAGIPEGVLNILPGFGETAGQAVGLHHDIDGVSFTGSTEIGKQFLRYSADSNMKRIFLECGGKSPNIVFSDSTDLEKVAMQSMIGAFYNQGQVCCAPTRLLVQEDIKEPLLEKLITASKNYQPSDPLDPKTELGAIIDQVQTTQIMSYIESGKTDGAELILGGKQVNKDSGGYFIEPTIFDGVKNSMKIAKEEIFGPVLSVITFKTMEEAVKLANDTHYGLAASIWTQDINKAHQIAQALRAGVVSVNCISSGDVTTPFGGFKQSGIGRESSVTALDNYTEIKTTWIEFA